MTGGALPILLALSCLSLLGLGVSAMLVARSQKEKDKRAARLAQVSQPKAAPRVVQVSAFTPSTRGRRRSFASICASLFGFNLRRVQQYKMPWWMVLLLTFLLAHLARMLADRLIGDLSFIALPIAWIFISRWVFGWVEKRRKQKAVVQLPDILDQVVRSVRVGTPVLEALRIATLDAPEPSRGEFVALIDQVSVGTSLEDAVVAMAERCGLPEYSFFATALSLQNQTGGALSETLLNLAEVVRKRVAIVEKGKALSSEAKATAVVLTALPFVTGAVMWFMNPDYMSLLYTEPTGNKLLAGAAVSLGLGLLTIRTMFQKALSLA